MTRAEFIFHPRLKLEVQHLTFYRRRNDQASIQGPSIHRDGAAGRAAYRRVRSCTDPESDLYLDKGDCSAENENGVIDMNIDDSALAFLRLGGKWEGEYPQVYAKCIPILPYNNIGRWALGIGRFYFLGAPLVYVATIYGYLGTSQK